MRALKNSPDMLQVGHHPAFDHVRLAHAVLRPSEGENEVEQVRCSNLNWVWAFGFRPPSQ